MRAKFEAEARAREEEERKRREEEDRRRKEEDERRRKEDEERRARQEKEEAERRAKEEAERKAREEEERKRREEEDRRRKEEDERRRREDEERRARQEKEDAERRARDEAEAKAKADAERRAKQEKEDAERKAREDEDRRRREEDDRRRKEDEERRAKQEKEEAERRARADAEAKAAAEAKPAAPAGGDIGDSLLADLDSFGQREEDERKEKEAAERKAKEEAARRAKEEAERRAKEEADRKRREEEDRRRKEEDERRAKEAAEREAREAREAEEQRQREEEERKRKAQEALAAKQSAERAATKAAASAKSAAAGDEDIDVSDDELDLDDVKRDQKALSKEARKAAREREEPVVVAPARKRNWGKPAAIALFVLLVAGVGVLNVMPISTAEYEKAASDALGVPVKVGSARLSVLAGVEVRLENVTVGEGVKIRLVRGVPELGSLFGPRKAFSRIELEGVAATQAQAGAAVFGKAGGENFRVARIVAKQLALEGPLKMGPLDVDATVGPDGALQVVKLAGADKLAVQISPKGGEAPFELSAGSFTVPFVPAMTLSDFSMKGTATAAGVTGGEFDGRMFDGVVSGTARIRWGSTWSVDGEVKTRAVKVAVFAPALVSDGRIEGRATYSMSGADPATLGQAARAQGEFKIEKGTLGSFDLTRALQTGGAQASGTTTFGELTGQVTYDKGVLQLRNLAIAAGAMNAGASLDIDANGGLAGRVAADVKTPTTTLRATLNISGKLQDPVIRK